MHGEGVGRRKGFGVGGSKESKESRRPRRLCGGNASSKRWKAEPQTPDLMGQDKVGGPRIRLKAHPERPNSRIHGGPGMENAIKIRLNRKKVLLMMGASALLACACGFFLQEMARGTYQPSGRPRKGRIIESLYKSPATRPWAIALVGAGTLLFGFGAGLCGFLLLRFGRSDTFVLTLGPEGLLYRGLLEDHRVGWEEITDIRYDPKGGMIYIRRRSAGRGKDFGIPTWALRVRPEELYEQIRTMWQARSP